MQIDMLIPFRRQQFMLLSSYATTMCPLYYRLAAYFIHKEDDVCIWTQSGVSLETELFFHLVIKFNFHLQTRF